MNANQKKLPYALPTLTVLGKVEQLTGLITRRNRDFLGHGNLL